MNNNNKVFNIENQICNILYIDLILCLRKYKLYELEHNNNNFDINIKDKNICNYIIKSYTNICLS